MEPLNASDSEKSVRYIEFKAISFVLPMIDRGDLKRSFEMIQNQNEGLNVNKWCVAKHTALKPYGEEYVQKVVYRIIENCEIVVYVPAEDVEQLMRNAYKIKFLFWTLPVDVQPAIVPSKFWIRSRRVGSV